MKLKPFHIALAFGILAAITSDKKEDPKKGTPRKKLAITEKDIITALRVIKNTYGTDIAKKVEKIYRNETANFSSLQFLTSRSAGMLAFSATFPYGWTKYKDLWEKYPQSAPIGVTVPFIVDKKPYKYIMFGSMLAAMIPLAEAIKKGGINAWGGYAGYSKLIDPVVPAYVNSFA